MADQINFNPLRVLDGNGDPVAGALAYFYATGTTTPVTVYSDENLITPHATPLVADAGGIFARVYHGETGGVKVNVTTAAGAAVDGFPIDPVMSVPSAKSGAADISFSPTVDVQADNVQDAIESVAANNVVSPDDLEGNAGYLFQVADDEESFEPVRFDSISQSFEWESLPESGLYHSAGGEAVGAPTTENDYGLVHAVITSLRWVQMAIHANSDRAFFRRKTDAGAQEWAEILHDKNFAQVLTQSITHVTAGDELNGSDLQEITTTIETGNVKIAAGAALTGTYIALHNSGAQDGADDAKTHVIFAKKV